MNDSVEKSEQTTFNISHKYYEDPFFEWLETPNLGAIFLNVSV